MGNSVLGWSAFEHQLSRRTRPRLALILILCLATLIYLLSSSSSSTTTEQGGDLQKNYIDLQHSYDELREQYVRLQQSQGSAPPQQQVNTFADFVQAEGCNPTTAELHLSHEPKCADKESTLIAMSHGGRHGFNAPYSTRGCDMRWFTVDEICAILSKFDRIHMVGDSLMRQLLLAMHVFMRADLVSGARSTWIEGNPEGQDCHCRTTFSKGSKCFWYEAIDTDTIWREDPSSMRCSREAASMSLALHPVYPIQDIQITQFIERVKREMPDKPSGEAKIVYILGSGVWNQFDYSLTLKWIDQMEAGLKDELPSFSTSPRLFITPSAAGENKPTEFVGLGNNIRVQRLVHAVESHAKARGIDHLGFYNLTIQAESPDGTHASLESTLTEAVSAATPVSDVTKP